MRQYGCLKAIFMSFYSPDLYRDVVRNWTGGVLLYLLLVLFICWSALIVNIQHAATAGYISFSQKFFPQIPAMTIKSGELSTPENRPYFIRDPDNNKVIAIIDASGKYNDLDNAPGMILLTKHSFSYKDKDHVEKKRDFSSTLNMAIQPAQVKENVGMFVHWLWLILFPFLILISFIYRIIQAAIYALFGMLFAALSSVSLTYGEIYKISIFAISPAMLIATICDWFMFTFPHQMFCYFLLSMGYLIFGIMSNRMEKEKNT